MDTILGVLILFCCKIIWNEMFLLHKLAIWCILPQDSNSFPFVLLFNIYCTWNWQRNGRIIWKADLTYRLLSHWGSKLIILEQYLTVTVHSNPECGGSGGGKGSERVHENGIEWWMNGIGEHKAGGNGNESGICNSYSSSMCFLPKRCISNSRSKLCKSMVSSWLGLGILPVAVAAATPLWHIF